MNPCPCGYFGDPGGRCTCPPAVIRNYRARVSGPLLDRIDLHVEVPKLEVAQMMRRGGEEEGNAAVLARVTKARAVQVTRARKPNARLSNRELEKWCPMERAAEALLEQSITALGLSARAYHRVRKVARTIADLDGRDTIALRHAAEAIQLRRLAL